MVSEPGIYISARRTIGELLRADNILINVGVFLKRIYFVRVECEEIHLVRL